MVQLLVILIAYFIGAIPTGYWFAKYLFGIDVTQHGSGNIGATNVARTLGGMKYFFVILAIDAGKAFLMLNGAAVAMARHGGDFVSPQLVLYGVALCLLLGNGYSVFLNFRGGKSVATFAGILLYFIAFWQVVLFAVAWVLIFSRLRQAFMASLGACAVVTVIHWLWYGREQLGLGLLLLTATGWIVYRHRSNLQQWLNALRGKNL